MHLTIRKKLYLSFGLLIVLLVCLGFYANNVLKNIEEEAVLISDDYVPSLDNSHRLITLATQYRVYQYRHIVASDAREMEVVEQAMQGTEKRMNEVLAAQEKLVAAENMAKFQKMRDQWTKMAEGSRRIIALSRSNQEAEAEALMAGEMKVLFDETSKALMDFANNNKALTDGATAGTKTEIGRAQGVLVTFIFVAFFLAVAVAFFISRGINRSLQKIMVVSKQVAKGDLSVSIDVRGSDEISELGLAYNETVRNIKTVVQQIQRTSESVAGASHELNASAEQTSEVTTQIADSITRVSTETDNQLEAVGSTTATVEELSAGIEQVAASASMSSDQATKAAEKAKDGAGSIERAVKQMERIEKTVNHSAQVVTKLGERSKEIGQIVDTIAGIAGQTNLLALNAAIEAARAGEQGKGFAVVAEEVRKLAEQSQAATEQIAALINEIQSDTDSAVTAMNEGTREVKVGTQVVDESGAAFQEIVGIAEQVSYQSRDIAATIQEMAASTEKIVGAVKGLSEVSSHISGETQSVSAATEEQAASMEEITTASTSLADMAQELSDITKKFKI